MQPNTLKTKPLLKSMGIDADLGGRNFAFLQVLTALVSEKQLVALEKAAKYGWKISKIVYGQSDCAVAINAPECAAWMTPDGQIHRAKAGQKTAYLKSDWKESV